MTFALETCAQNGELYTYVQCVSVLYTVVHTNIPHAPTVILKMVAGSSGVVFNMAYGFRGQKSTRLMTRVGHVLFYILYIH